MLFYNFFSYRKAYTCTLIFFSPVQALKQLKYLFIIRFIYAYAVVAHFELSFFAMFFCRYFDNGRIIFFPELDSIADKVLEQ